MSTSPTPESTELSLTDKGHIAHIAIILVSLCLAELFHRNINSLFTPPPINLRQIFLLWIPAATLPCLCHYLCGAWSEGYRKHWISAVSDSLDSSVKTRIALALGAAFGEELLFRCVLQPWSGILATVLLVLILTPGPSGKLTPITALCCGQTLLYGQMTAITQSIWPSLFAHSVVNLWFIFFTPQQDHSFA